MGLLDNFFKPQSQSEAEAKRSVEILERLKQRRGQETGKWLSMMQSASAAPPPVGPAPTIEDVDSREVLDEQPYAPPMEAQYATMSVPMMTAPGATAAKAESESQLWIRELFAECDRQAEQYNREHPGTKLILTVHPPEFTYAEPEFGQPYDPHKAISLFKGHIATLHWAMLLQGNDDKIEIYVLAAEEILNFTLNDIHKSSLSPFMTVSSSIADGHRSWNVGGTAIGKDVVAPLVKELLGDLLRIATGTMSEAELFADHRGPLKLGETVAHGYEAPKAEQASMQPNTVPSGSNFDSLATWGACETLVKALDKDLGWLTGQESMIDAQKDPETAKRISALASKLRGLAGQVSTLVSEYRQTGSKYNAS